MAGSEKLLLISFIYACSNLVNAGQLPLFPAILVFGDSTVDAGNNNYISTLFKGNHPPYGRDYPGGVATGRFSNGKLVTDVLASLLNIKSAVPPFLDPNLSDADIRTGVSFASGGAGYDDTTNFATAIPLTHQIPNFIRYFDRLRQIAGETEAARIVNHAMVVLSCGANDMAFNFYGNPVRSQRLTVGEYQDFLLGKMNYTVQALYKLGVRNMLITGLPPVGCLPIQMSLKRHNLLKPVCVAEQNADSVIYNKKAVNMFSVMEKECPGLKLGYANIYDPLLDMIEHAPKFGFLVTRVGCCGTGKVEGGPLCNLLSPTCQNSSNHVFWDSIHPSQAAYSYIAQFLYRYVLPKFL
uniref:GDSL esterase/lipase n=1 Tax=Kalanchoe fedtschenkoi TaxID=63787 RepID=A0A7N0RBV3_KALFE